MSRIRTWRIRAFAEALESTPTSKIRALLWVYAATGIPIVELIKLRKEVVRLDERLPFLALEPLAEGGEPRRVSLKELPFVVEIIEALPTFRSAGTGLFPGLERATSLPHINRAWREAKRRARLTPSTPWGSFRAALVEWVKRSRSSPDFRDHARPGPDQKPRKRSDADRLLSADEIPEQLRHKVGPVLRVSSDALDELRDLLLLDEALHPQEWAALPFRLGNILASAGPLERHLDDRFVVSPRDRREQIWAMFEGFEAALNGLDALCPEAARDVAARGFSSAEQQLLAIRSVTSEVLRTEKGRSAKASLVEGEADHGAEWMAEWNPRASPISDLLVKGIAAAEFARDALKGERKSSRTRGRNALVWLLASLFDEFHKFERPEAADETGDREFYEELARSRVEFIEIALREVDLEIDERIIRRVLAEHRSDHFPFSVAESDPTK
jgi:hypothetical protein